VLESQLLEDRREPLRHVEVEGFLHFVPGNLDTRNLAVKTDAELPEAQGFQRFLAILDLLDVFDRHGSAVRNARTETGRRRTVPGGESGLPGELSDFGLR